ncbi:MAG: hypothetical protein IPI18_21725 [Saprospiraceae bacterium]|nr:hypothetical protein [Saprospiraceae bacterium]
MGQIQQKPISFALQEIKAKEDQIDMDSLKKAGYDFYWFPAEKARPQRRGILTKIKPG